MCAEFNPTAHRKAIHDSCLQSTIRFFFIQYPLSLHLPIHPPPIHSSSLYYIFLHISVKHIPSPLSFVSLSFCSFLSSYSVTLTPLALSQFFFLSTAFIDFVFCPNRYCLLHALVKALSSFWGNNRKERTLKKKK